MAVMAERGEAGPAPGRIAVLNDEFRRTGRCGRVMLTAGIAAAWDLLLRVAPHLEIGADTVGPAEIHD